MTTQQLNCTQKEPESLDDSLILSDKRIKLNVGGKLFETYQRTLIQSKYFNSMFDKFAESKSNNEIFIDRSPVLFEHILNYLRDPGYKIPKICYSEFLFYGIEWPKKTTEISKLDKPDKAVVDDRKDNVPGHAGVIKVLMFNDGRFTGLHMDILRKIPKYLSNSTELIMLEPEPTFSVRKGILLYKIARYFESVQACYLHAPNDIIYNIKNIGLEMHNVETKTKELIANYDVNFIIAYKKINGNNFNNGIFKVPFWFGNENNDNLYIANSSNSQFYIKMELISPDEKINEKCSLYIDSVFMNDENRTKLSNTTDLMHSSLAWVRLPVVGTTVPSEFKIRLDEIGAVKKILLYSLLDDGTFIKVKKVVATTQGIKIINTIGEFIRYNGNKNDAYYITSIYGGKIFNHDAMSHCDMIVTVENSIETKPQLFCYVEKLRHYWYNNGTFTQIKRSASDDI